MDWNQRKAQTLYFYYWVFLNSILKQKFSKRSAPQFIMATCETNAKILRHVGSDHSPLTHERLYHDTLSSLQQQWTISTNHQLTSLQSLTLKNIHAQAQEIGNPFVETEELGHGTRDWAAISKIYNKRFQIDGKLGLGPVTKLVHHPCLHNKVKRGHPSTSIG